MSGDTKSLSFRLKWNEIKKLLSSPLIFYPIIVASVALAIVLEYYAEPPISSDNWIKTIVFVTVQSFVAMIVFAVFLRLKEKEQFTQSVDKISTALEASNMKWLLSETEVKYLEEKAKCVWIMSPSLANDVNLDGEIIKAVSRNLAKGVKYTYFLPNTKLINGQINEYKEIYLQYLDSVEFVLVPDDEYHFYTEVAIYNADEIEKENIAIEWLPDESYDYYIRLDKQHTSSVVGIASIMKQKYKKS
jgi:hypothetical protein